MVILLAISLPLTKSLDLNKWKTDKANRDFFNTVLVFFGFFRFVLNISINLISVKLLSHNLTVSLSGVVGFDHKTNTFYIL